MTSSYLNLRIGPATTSMILMIVPPGVALTVSGDSQTGYFPVVYGEKSGWVSTELVQVEMRTEPAAAAEFDESKLLPDGVATLVESLNLAIRSRHRFTTRFEVVDAGTEVEASGEISGAYEKVKVDDKEGWVRSVYVDRDRNPRVTARHEELLLAAVARHGTPTGLCW